MGRSSIIIFCDNLKSFAVAAVVLMNTFPSTMGPQAVLPTPAHSFICEVEAQGKWFFLPSVTSDKETLTDTNPDQDLAVLVTV
ncbi:hypothetical protein Y1Q_0009919 [Alligator mississippiensis]|uniref:Uncharacterized protein n=1 Tax=Alligator mississippiensis TaxID=8496 RepID=A0A151MXH7_ALLMI|nr:hypothetical protein Y1Q_0009919 [Alligator mississippiensis]